MREPGEEMDRALGRTRTFCFLFIEEIVALVPQAFRNDRLDLVQYPLTLGFELPCFLAVRRLGVVGTTNPLRGRVAQEALDGGVRECGTIPSPIAIRVENPCH